MRIRKMNKFLLSLFIAFNFIETNHAQIQLSLQAAIDSALQNNLNIQVSRNNLAIAELNNSYANAGADFGRRNILSLRQNLISRILELEKDHLYKKYKEAPGTNDRPK